METIQLSKTYRIEKLLDGVTDKFAFLKAPKLKFERGSSMKTEWQ